MSVSTWWEERKRRQEEREARRLGEEWDEEEAWTDPGEDEEVAAVEPVAAEVENEAGTEPVEVETEAEPVVAEVPEPEPEEVAGEETPEPEDDVPSADGAAPPEEPAAGPGELSWWKRRLFAAAQEAEPDPEPIAEEPEPAPVAEEPEPAPVAEEPVAEGLDEEPLAEEAEPVPYAAAEELDPAPQDELVYEDAPAAEAVAETLVDEEADLAALEDDDDLLYEEEPFLDAVPDEDAPPPVHDFPGPRRARLEGERRRRRTSELRRGLIAAGLAAIVGLAGIVTILSRDEARRPPSGVTARGADTRDTITTTLVFGTKEQRQDAGPTWLALLSYDTAEERGSVVFIPPHTATGVPGRGLLPVGDALESGGIPLLLLATETLLGTGVDRYLELSDRDAAVLFDETGPLTVDVPHEVKVSAGPGQARLIFAPGPQRLSPGFLVDLLYLKGLDGNDVELGARHLAFWSSMFEAFSFDADGLAEAVRGAGAAVGESDASPQELGELFEQLAATDPDDRTLALLPVRQVGVGGSELYQTDSKEVEAFLTDTIGAPAVAGKQVRIQILNGNGAPGIGQHVAQRLGDEGFRVILSGNARRLNYRETLVITYDRSSEGVGLAERTRDLIGVGEVQVAAQSQGIVDLTIVVGKDFLKTL